MVVVEDLPTVYQCDPFRIYILTPVADPGFPVGGRGPVRGGMDLRCGCFLAKMYVKTKEFGPIGGVCTQHAPLDPPMDTISFTV